MWSLRIEGGRVLEWLLWCGVTPSSRAVGPPYPLDASAFSRPVLRMVTEVLQAHLMVHLGVAQVCGCTCNGARMRSRCRRATPMRTSPTWNGGATKSDLLCAHVPAHLDQVPVAVEEEVAILLHAGRSNPMLIGQIFNVRALHVAVHRVWRSVRTLYEAATPSVSQPPAHPFSSVTTRFPRHPDGDRLTAVYHTNAEPFAPILRPLAGKSSTPASLREAAPGWQCSAPC